MTKAVLPVGSHCPIHICSLQLTTLTLQQSGNTSAINFHPPVASAPTVTQSRVWVWIFRLWLGCGVYVTLNYKSFTTSWHPPSCVPRVLLFSIIIVVVAAVVFSTQPLHNDPSLHSLHTLVVFTITLSTNRICFCVMSDCE